MTQPTITDINDTIVAGNDWQGTFTLTKNGGVAWDLDGATITCSIYDQEDEANALISGLAVTNNGGTSSQAVLTLTDNGASDGSNLLHVWNDLGRSRAHIADFKIVETSNAVTNADKFRLFVVKKAT